jgi:glycosyltransferase involved in cell wall biosynthesis
MKGLSIILTYYKGEKYIQNCIDSIIASYNYSSKAIEYEIIVIIDSMDDGFLAKAMLEDKYKQVHVRVFKNSNNIGVSESRNFGLSLIQYKFYTIIDQDDLVKLRYFSTIESRLSASVSIQVLNGVIRYVNEGFEVPIYTFPPRFKFKNIILKETFIYTPGLLIFNSDLIPPDGLFLDTSEKYKGCDDWAAYLNIMLSTKEVLTYEFIDEKLFVYCLHSNNYSNDKEQMINSSKAVLDHLSTHARMDSTRMELITQAKLMQEFYLSKDVNMKSKIVLLIKYPNEFLTHYFLSLLQIDNTNKLILKLRYQLNKFGLIRSNLKA